MQKNDRKHSKTKWETDPCVLYGKIKSEG